MGDIMSKEIPFSVLAQEEREFFTLALFRINFSDAERLKLKHLAPTWEQKQYQSDERVKHYVDTEGIWILYRARRAIAANALPPNLNTNDWLRLG